MSIRDGFTGPRRITALLFTALFALISVLIVGIPTASAAPAKKHAAIVFTEGPGTGAPPAKLGKYTMKTFPTDTTPCETVESSISGPTGTLGFSPDLLHLTVPDCWVTWSNGYSSDVYWNQATSEPNTITLTMPAKTKAFYLYAEPEDYEVFTVTAVAAPGAVSSGPVSVNGDGGAEFFGFYSKGHAKIKSITITCTDADGFAVGEFGIAS